MKKIIVILACLATLGCVKKVPFPKTVQYVDVPEMRQKELHEAAKRLVATNFVSAKRVIEYDNVEEGTLIGNSMIRRVRGDWNISFTMRVDSKDDKYRVSYYNVCWYAMGHPELCEFKEKHIEEVRTMFDMQISTALHKYVTTGIETEKDW